MNKPKIKDIVLYTHPIMGDVTVGNIIEMLNFWIEYTKKYEDVSLELLHKLVDEETFNSLFHLLSSSLLKQIIFDLESNIE